MPIWRSSFGCASGNRNESDMMIGKKKIQSNQNEQVCASEADHGSEFTTVAVKVNKTTTALHKHRPTQRGANRQIIRRFVEKVFTGLLHCPPMAMPKSEIARSLMADTNPTLKFLKRQMGRTGQWMGLTQPGHGGQRRSQFGREKINIPLVISDPNGP